MVDFSQIPAAGQIREGLFFLEMDPSKAGSQVEGRSAVLFVGQMMATGTATAGVLARCYSPGHALDLCGQGSQIHESVTAWRDNEATAEMWILPYADLGGGTAQSYTLTPTGPATADGTLHVYIGGRHIEVAVTNGDAANTIATNLDAAINADTDCCMTSGVVAPLVTVTAKHAAEFTAYIDVRTNYLGDQGLEEFPAGVTCPVAALAAGAGDPDISGMAAAIGTERFDFIVHPWRTSTLVTDPVSWIEDLHNHVDGKWSYLNQSYGHAFCNQRDTVGNLTTWGNAQNDPHLSAFPMNDAGIPQNPWQVAAAAAGAIYTRLSNDPGRPHRGIRLRGILPAPRAARFTWAERDGLLFDGLGSLYMADDGTVRVGRVTTTYQTDEYGAADDAYLDCSTLFCLMAFNRAMSDLAASLVGKKLVDDGTYIAPGSETVTPDIVKGMIIATYGELERRGIVENTELFAANLTVVRPSGDSNRLDCIVEPDVVNKLEVLAMLNRFRLQYLAA
jgi:phage tail sheath gpL-like